MDPPNISSSLLVVEASHTLYIYTHTILHHTLRSYDIFARLMVGWVFVPSSVVWHRYYGTSVASSRGGGVPGESPKDFLREDWGTLGITIRILGNQQPPLGESPATLKK